MSSKLSRFPEGPIMYFQTVLFSRFSRKGIALLPACVLLLVMSVGINAQDTVTGAFEGRVISSQGGTPIPGASVQFINQLTGVPIAKRSDSEGRFYQGLLPPGTYTIRVSAANFKPREIELRLLATRSNTVVPVPVSLDPETTAATPTPTPTGTTPTTQPATQVSAQAKIEDSNIIAELNATDARRGGAFTDKEVTTLPLGSRTYVRSFDELALLLPGVAAPPQPIGSGTGPGVGAGVGTSGQFSVNGLRSRANNFTVDGSDNNDEDIGVRRQGFFALVPQPVESIQEFQVITLLAPAQFGRNIGAQVNAISKSGGNETHGTGFGFFNSSQLNARNAFDSTNGSAVSPLTSGAQSVIRCTTAVNCFAGVGTPISVINGSDGEDSFTLGQGGFVLGGPIKKDRMFYFVSFEGQKLNASQEASFAVPTVAQRGVSIPGTVAANGSGATGIFVNPFNGVPTRAFPTATGGDAIFSLFPFPNNPGGVYGANTFTQTLPADAEGKVISAKVDGNFKVHGRQQSFTARYNFTGDERTIPVTGNALFSSLRPDVRTQNFSTFLNSELTDPSSTSPIFNQLRLSYGRTRLNFQEVRDNNYQIPSQLFPNEPFLLNARLLQNFTVPPAMGVPNAGAVPYLVNALTTEDLLGPVGQVSVAGFSPVGVDVFNFPQRRVNNTYQAADTLTWRKGSHNLTFGTDLRRTELNSDLPRNSRPLITFNGAPRLLFDPVTGFSFANSFISPLDLVSSDAASGFFQTLDVAGGSTLNLRYYQLNFFAQDEWRIKPNFSLSYGLRYEYNTTPHDNSGRIEETFNSPDLSLAPGLDQFIAGRKSIFEADKNNFAPRVGFAYSPKLFGPERTTVIRAGYGIYYDQILGAVVSQSRNVFPNFLTVNLAGGLANLAFDPTTGTFGTFGLLSPSNPLIALVQPGTLNTLDLSMFTLADQIDFINLLVGGGFLPGASGVGVTLPAPKLDTPMAHHYSVSFEQQLNRQTVFSAAYVGTLGRNLIRFTTPNLGPNAILLPLFFSAGVTSFVPEFSGLALQPGTTITPAGFIVGGRPVNTVGTVNVFETTAESRYDALQLQLRGRFGRGLQYQANYTWSKVEDDVSDVFDLAGAPALPQNSNPNSPNYLRGERAPANFDVRHRFSYNLIYDFPEYQDRSKAFRFAFGGLQIASIGKFQSGQPFTVNSIFDVNLDGNLTDRLNSTTGLVVTGDRSRPLILNANPASLRAAVGQDGSVARNSFRAGNVLELDLSVIKKFAITERQSLSFRMDVFNFIDRANYGIPVRYLEAPGFGRAVDTVTPGRRIQFGLTFSF